MIVRVFRGRVHAGAQEGFERLLRTKAVPQFRAHPGVAEVRLGTPTDHAPDEFLVITVWKDLASLRGFAGDRWLEARISPQERHLLRAAYVHHYRGPEEDLRTDVLAPSPRRTGRDGSPAPRALLLPGGTIELAATVAALRERGFETIVAPDAATALRLVPRWRPDVAVVATDADGDGRVREEAARGALPTIVVGGEEDLPAPGGSEALRVGVLAPGRAAEIAGAAEIVADGRLPHAAGGAVELGALRLDLGQRLVRVEDRVVELPPAEFRVLTELAMRAEEPVAPSELARRVWPDNPWTTAEDVRRVVYRLRKLIGDQERVPPLIRNRRGHGYLLSP